MLQCLVCMCTRRSSTSFHCSPEGKQLRTASADPVAVVAFAEVSAVHVVWHDMSFKAREKVLFPSLMNEKMNSHADNLLNRVISAGSDRANFLEKKDKPSCRHRARHCTNVRWPYRNLFISCYQQETGRIAISERRGLRQGAVH
jgi:hypothetical protein